jgi:hypothetical protein
MYDCILYVCTRDTTYIDCTVNTLYSDKRSIDETNYLTMINEKLRVAINVIEWHHEMQFIRPSGTAFRWGDGGGGVMGEEL